jgi:putative DNA primase/helicase
LDDRRYLVVKTPTKLDAAVYSEVAAELAAGGAERFYRYLLEYDCGDFSPHTKPIETEAKRDLIERSQPSSELFLAEWQAGLLPMPFGPCLSEDLYRAYQTWCRRGGERNPAKINDFSQDAKLAGLRRQQKRVDVPGRTERQMRTVFLFGAPDPGEAERDWLKKKLDGFRGDLDAYARGEQV